ncbi:ThuA domain-containing protein [Motilibacter aurantiacus]|uniref:ThuA domain-containing protein n=1 Tax=Motilibacter aurantiacus TaxID=2714955 RepID=UPI002F2B42DD
MRRFTKWVTAAAVVAGSMAPMAPAGAADEPFDVLVFSKTAAFRHTECINSGTPAIKALGAANNFTVDSTEDAAVFSDASLAKYETVIFLCTTGNVLNDAQQGAFERYIEAGGGYMGVHSASDTEYDWAWYGGLVGAYFRDHPGVPGVSPQFQVASVDVLGHGTPATAGLPDRWTREEEWYNFRTNPTGTVRVLANVDETTYNPRGYSVPGGSAPMGNPHPISWCQNYDGGRSFYTAVGHKGVYFSEPLVLSHLLGGITMTAGAAEFNCTTYSEVTTLLDDLKDEGRLSASAYASLSDRLQRASVKSAAGHEVPAMGLLEQFVAKARNQVKGDADDVAVRELLVQKAGELIAWEQDLEDQENGD